MKTKNLYLTLLILLLTSCSDSTNSTNSNTTGTDGVGSCKSKSFGSGVPDWIVDNFDCVQVTVSGSNYVFVTNNIPEHNSAYFPTDDSRYVSTMPSGRSVNPNQISEQSYTLTIPSSPASSGGVATSGNAIGVAIDGVVFFNNEAAAPDTLSDEVDTLDTANAHPTGSGAYHYHIEPTEITSDDAKLIGVLRDGYPVFGRKCPETNDYPGTGTAALDSYNGHTANTNITGLGTIYHYHLADMSGDGVTETVVTDTYYGTPGSMVNN